MMKSVCNPPKSPSPRNARNASPLDIPSSTGPNIVEAKKRKWTFSIFIPFCFVSFSRSQFIVLSLICLETNSLSNKTSFSSFEQNLFSSSFQLKAQSASFGIESEALQFIWNCFNSHWFCRSVSACSIQWTTKLVYHVAVLFRGIAIHPLIWSLHRLSIQFSEI